MHAHLGPEQIIMTDGLQPFIVRTSRGTLLVQSQLSFPPGYKPPAQNAYPGLPGTIISRDRGRTWQKWRPQLPAATGPVHNINDGWSSLLTPELAVPIFEGTFAELRDGTVVIVEWVAAGPDDNKLFHGKLWESRDDLLTLTGPLPFAVHIPKGKAGNDDGGRPYPAITFHRNLIELPGGDWLAPVYGWLEGDDTPVAYQPKMRKNRVMLVRSRDRGRTWKFVATVAADQGNTEEGFNESTMVRLSRGPQEGRLVCLMRAGHNDTPVYQTHSDDDGATWAAPRKLGFNGVSPDLIERRDGTLVCAVGRRRWDDPDNLRGYQVVVSTDQGGSWEVLARWRNEPYAGAEQATHYCSVTEIAPGTILVFYDVGVWSQPVRYTAMREVKLA